MSVRPPSPKGTDLVLVRAALLLNLVLLLPAVTVAQTQPGPPGPYVLDLHGATMGVPNAGEFYPALPEMAIVPGRAFGFDAGGQVLGPRFGAARLGFGGSVIVVRGKVGPPDVSATLTAIAPQISLNFGTADGWSYLSAGFGPGRISTKVSPGSAVTPVADQEADAGTEDETPTEPVRTTVETGAVGTFNVGGGARWFVNPHTAVGFDVRFYRFAASSDAGTPATTRVALSVGVSLR